MVDMRFFQFTHLKPELQQPSKTICEAAWKIHKSVPDGPEKTTALRKLLEAKDAAVRAVVYPPEQ